MAMTVNPSASPGTAAPFRDEGLYAFRFDTNGDKSARTSPSTFVSATPLTATP